MYLDMQSDEEDNPDQNGGGSSNYDDKENNDFPFDETIVKVEPAY